jgi:hypothetical protein
MATLSAPIIIKMPPAAAAKAKAVAPSPSSPGVVSPKAGSALDKLVASTAPAAKPEPVLAPGTTAPPVEATTGVSPSLTPEGAPIHPVKVAPKLTIAPGLLPLTIKSPPAAPVMAAPATARHPIGVGDMHDRLVALEVHVLTMFGQLKELMQDV